MRPGRKLTLRAAYEIAELADLLGMSRKRARRLLRGLGILRQPGGPRSKLYVYLGDLKRSEPDLWESLLDKLSAA